LMRRILSIIGVAVFAGVRVKLLIRCYIRSRPESLYMPGYANLFYAQ
jgi:hypothetical protein